MRTKAEQIMAAPSPVIGDELLRGALDSMSYGFSLWDDNYNLSLFNSQYQKMYYPDHVEIWAGMSLFDICSLSVAGGNHPGVTAQELVDNHCERFAELTKPGQRLSIEKNVHGRVYRSTYMRTETVGWIVTHEDVTEAVTQRQALEAREALLARQNVWMHMAVEHMSYGLCMFGPDKRMIICNQAYAEMHQLPPELAIPGTHVEDIFRYRVKNGLLPDGEQAEAYMARRMELVDQSAREHHFMHRESGRLLAVVCRPMPDGGWVATHQDITEQKQREDLIADRNARLEQQNMRFDAAVNNMAHGLAMFDANFELVVCNQAFADIYDLPERLTQQGSSFWDMLDDGESKRMVSILDPIERRIELEKAIRKAEQFVGPVNMVNGRIIQIRHQPLADGGWLATHEDVTEQHQSEEIIRKLARYDSLTGLANRSVFIEAMAELETLCGAGTPAAVFCIDFNNFKGINDNLGHAAGDAVLQEISRRMVEEIGSEGLVARLGGDEFAVICGGVSGRRRTADIATRLINAASKPIDWEGVPISTSISIGVALAPEHGSSSETLLRNADLALYEAKDNNRSAYRFFARNMHETQERRRVIDAGLKQALEDDKLELYYQPILATDGGKINCCEALMRWNGPEGPVSPADFIAVAEETGLIRELGGWALHEACRTAANWAGDIRVAVNVSPIQFAGRALLHEIESALEKSGLAPNRLELEITESLFLDDNAHNLALLHALRGMGVRIALDDFGTGYSSLSYLRRFPFSKIKIDRSFISALSEQSDNKAIVRAVADLGGSFGMGVTAEGVETEAQLEMVRAEGCTEAQGFLFSPPLPRSAIETLLASYQHNPAQLRKIS